MQKDTEIYISTLLKYHFKELYIVNFLIRENFLTIYCSSL